MRKETRDYLTEALEIIPQEDWTGREGWQAIGEIVTEVQDNRSEFGPSLSAWATEWRSARDQSGKRDSRPCIDALLDAIRSTLHS